MRDYRNYANQGLDDSLSKNLGLLQFFGKNLSDQQNQKDLANLNAQNKLALTDKQNANNLQSIGKLDIVECWRNIKPRTAIAFIKTRVRQKFCYGKLVVICWHKL